MPLFDDIEKKRSETTTLMSLFDTARIKRK